MFVILKSFGYKYDENPVSDLQFDLRNRIRNPQSHLPKNAVGTDLIVRRTVLKSSANQRVLEKCHLKIMTLVRNSNAESKLVVAFGCRSGIHRSVVFAEEIARRLRKNKVESVVEHLHLKQ